jgi:3D (Asp-Asp-Asp) domain-containing protein
MRKSEKSIMHSKLAPIAVLLALNLLLVTGFCAAHKIYETKQLRQSEMTLFKKDLRYNNLELQGIGNKQSGNLTVTKDLKNTNNTEHSRKKVQKAPIIQKIEGKEAPVPNKPTLLKNVVYKAQKALGLHPQKEKEEIKINGSKVKAEPKADPKANPKTNPKVVESSKADPKTIQKENQKEKQKTVQKSGPMKFLARITVYWAKGRGTDKWSAQNISSTGTKLKCGVHAAVDPKVIPYGSKVKLTKGTKEVLVKAVDTGSHVKKRKAAIAMGKTPLEKNAPVVDLFFQTRSDAMAYAKNNPHFQWVKVYPPESTL